MRKMLRRYKPCSGSCLPTEFVTFQKTLCLIEIVGPLHTKMIIFPIDTPYTCPKWIRKELGCHINFTDVACPIKICKSLASYLTLCILDSA